MSILAYACCDYAAWIGANPSPSHFELREAAGAVQYATRQKADDYAARYAFERACDLAACGYPASLNQLARAYVMKAFCPYGDDPPDEGAYYAERERRIGLMHREFERRFLAEVTALLPLPVRPEEPAPRTGQAWWEAYETDGNARYDELHDELTADPYCDFVDALPPAIDYDQTIDPTARAAIIDATTDLDGVIGAVIGAWGEGRDNPIGSGIVRVMMKELRITVPLETPDLSPEDAELLRSFAHRYHNMLCVISALERLNSDDKAYKWLNSIGGDGGVFDKILECPSRSALWRAQGWLNYHNLPGESLDQMQARVLREVLKRELNVPPEFDRYRGKPESAGQSS